MDIPWQKLGMTDAHLEPVLAEVSPTFHDLDFVCVCVCGCVRTRIRLSTCTGTNNSSHSCAHMPLLLSRGGVLFP